MTILCEICSKSFQDEHDLSRHMSKHKREKYDLGGRQMCDICAKLFRDKCDLNRHMRIHEREKYDLRGSKLCDICAKSFRDKCDLSRHMRIHERGKYDLGGSKLCPICKAETKILQAHVYEVHNIKVKQESKTFTSLTEFMKWKEKVEQDMQSVYVKKFGTKKRKDGSFLTYYYCHRDGKYVKRGNNIRSVKKIGSNKIDAGCTSSMKVKELRNKNVMVTFVSTHVGHSHDINRMPLSKTEKDKIASQISMKVPLNNILDEIRNSVEGESETIRRITKQNLRNIIACYKLDKEQCNENDVDAVEKWINHMNEKCELVRFYKPQGITVNEFSELIPEDFCLILSNNAQIDCLNHFGNNIICILGTNDVAGCNYQMFSLVVLDEMGAGFPCAFMFTNRNDTIIMKMFFKTIFSCVKSDIAPEYLMTDIGDVFYNAWFSAFPNATTRHLYCGWHVDKEWRENLNKIKTDEMRVEVYKRIKVLMNERDKDTFEIVSRNLLGELYLSPLTIEFARYFEAYVLEPSKWAYCYRMSTAVNTDMVLERLHRNLKHISAAGKKNKQLIKSIHALYSFQSRFRTRNSYQGNVKKKLSSIRKRHKISENLSFDSVRDISIAEWMVFNTEGTETYIVSFLENVCDCILRCEHCDACIHSYCCTCTDSAVLWTMCKHIHLVCRRNFASSSQSPDTQQEVDITDIQLAELSANKQQPEANICIPSHTKVQNLQARKIRQLENVIKILNKITTEGEMEGFENFMSPLEVLLDASRQQENVQNSVTEEKVLDD